MPDEKPREAAAASKSRRPRSAGKGVFLAGMAVGAVASTALFKFARPQTLDASDGSRPNSGAWDRRAAPRNWKDVAANVFKAFNDHQTPAVAAGATFYALLALFPALAAFVSLYGLFSNVDDARRQILALHGVLPTGAISVLSSQMARLARVHHQSLTFAFFIGLIVSIVSSNAGVKAVMAGLNVAVEAREQRGFVRLNLVSLTFTLGAIAFSMLTAFAIVGVSPMLTRLGFQSMAGLSLLRWPAIALVATVLISVLYRWGPSRSEGHWRWITPGGVAAALGWLAMSLAFSAYVARFGHYDATYGALGALIGFMTWIWLSLIVVLAGAELNFQLEARDLSAGAG